MTYTPDYTEDDLEAATFDGMGKAIITVGKFMAIIIFVGLAVWGITVFRRARR